MADTLRTCRGAHLPGDAESRSQRDGGGAALMARTQRRAPLLLRIAAVVLAVGPAAAAAQQLATVQGRATGADGRPAADAAIVLLDQLGFEVAATRTDPTGRFRIAGVAPGTYTLRAEAPPRQSAARVVVVASALPLDIAMRLTPRLADRVVVAPARELPQVARRVTVGADALQHMPARLPGRGLQDMLATLPGWAAEDNGLLHVRGVDDGVLFVVDGVPVYDRLDTLFGVAPHPASIGSVNVVTGYIAPEYSFKSGAVVEVQSAALRGDSWTGTAEAGTGGDGLWVARLSGGGPVLPRTSMGMSVAAERSDRFLDPVHPDGFHNTGAATAGDLRVQVAGPRADLVRLHASAARSRYDVPHGAVQEAAGQDQRQRLLQTAGSVSWQRAWSDALVSYVAAHHRRIDATLHGSEFDTPLFADAGWRHGRLGALASVTAQHGRHTLKAGAEAGRLMLREDFTFAVTDPESAEEADISDAAAVFTPARPFVFADRADRAYWSLYVQDAVQVSERLSLEFGLRFDRTNLLVPARQWSPRAGAAYRLSGRGATLRASVNRLFQPPQPEHLLLSSSAAARALSPFAAGGGDAAAANGGAELAPERQTAWEVGLDQPLGRLATLDVAAWGRHVRNYADPNVFFGTTIVFPNSVAKGEAYGLDLRLELPRYRGWSAYGSYTLSKVVQTGPVNGGLFLEEHSLEIGPGTRFTPDHDQRHGGAAGVTWQGGSRGFAASLTGRFASGTPIEAAEDDLEGLMARPGAALVNFEGGRVRPRGVLDLSVAHRLYRHTRADVSARLSVLNLADAAYALNFGNPFSGTHFGAPRTIRFDVQVRTR